MFLDSWLAINREHPTAPLCCWHMSFCQEQMQRPLEVSLQQHTSKDEKTHQRTHPDSFSSQDSEGQIGIVCLFRWVQIPFFPFLQWRDVVSPTTSSWWYTHPINLCFQVRCLDISKPCGLGRLFRNLKSTCHQDRWVELNAWNLHVRRELVFRNRLLVSTRTPHPTHAHTCTK